MLFDFHTILVYSPSGNSLTAIDSRTLLGACKNGNINFAQNLSKKIFELKQEFFFENSVFVPVPRSTPLMVGAVYPSKILAETLVSNGLGNGVYECLKRTKAIPKSSSQFSADSRNSVQTHLNSISVSSLIISEPTIIVIDDVLTLGRTTMASAIKLKEAYPDKEIKIFSPFRTRSFGGYEDILIDVQHGEMILSSNDKVILPD